MTEDELKRLANSEHPVLRAIALRTMLKRKSIQQFGLLMSHLDDTAIVNTDAGEFGIYYRRVSDDLIRECDFENREEKNKAVEEIIAKHDYLNSAYTILGE